MSKGSKYFWLVVSIVFAVSAVLFGKIYSKKEPMPTSTVESVEIKPTEKDLTSELNELYLDDKTVFLSEGISDDKIKSLEEKVEKSNDDKIKKMLKDVKKKNNIQKEFNSLFEESVLKGGDFKESVGFKTETSVDDVNALIVKLDKDNAFYNGMKKYLSNEATKNGMIIDEGTTTTTTGTASLEAANQAINSIVVDGYVQDGFTMEQYTIARDAVHALPEGPEKDGLMTELQKIETSLTNMGVEYQ